MKEFTERRCHMEVQRITVDELKAMMDMGEPVLVLDVRGSSGYATSSKKIKGAVYLDPDDEVAIKEFARSLDRNRSVVTY
jgi:hypothetical protein